MAQSPHHAVEESLAILIERGQPGDRLPAEPALAAQLGVSRYTLREALRSFVERGLIVRRQGAGTFIAPPHPVIENGLEFLESISNMAQRIGLEVQMDQATIEERPAQPDELAGLGLKTATQVLSVARALVVDARPVAYLVDTVPIKYLRKRELKKTFNGSVLDVFLERGQPTLAHSRTDLVATVADAALAQQLRIRRGSPLLRLEAQLHTQDGQIVNYSISHFVPGYFRFHVIRRVST